MTRHIKAHTKIPYICAFSSLIIIVICSCMYVKDRFNVRLFSDTGVQTIGEAKSFVCLDCGKTFARNSELTKHSSRVHPSRELACDIVAKSAKTKGYI